MMVAPAQRVVGFPLSSSAEAAVERCCALSSSAEAKAAWYQPQRSLLSEELLARASQDYTDSSDWSSDEDDEDDPDCDHTHAGMHVGPSSSGSEGSLLAEPRLKRQRSTPVPIAISE